MFYNNLLFFLVVTCLLSAASGKQLGGDSDGDGVGDAVDVDDDNDGVLDSGKY
jgi:hypothetical protein